jgi:hypothetical protein
MDINDIDIQTFCDLQGGVNDDNLDSLRRSYRGQKKTFWEWHTLVSQDVNLTEPKFPAPAKKTTDNK